MARRHCDEEVVAVELVFFEGIEGADQFELEIG